MKLFPPLLLLAAAVLAAIPAGAATYYVDFRGGDDANDGLSASTAWTHAPGDANAAGNAARALRPGDTVLFKGGVAYKGTVTASSNGASGKPVTYKGDGWGAERAVIDGSEPVTGWTPCASQESCGGNSNWRSIYVATIPPLPAFLDAEVPFALNLYQGETPLTVAQFPESPNPLYQLHWDYFSVPPSAVTATSLTDPRLASYGGPSLVGSWIYVWVTPNLVILRKILGYDALSSTISFAPTDVNKDKPTKYALANRVQDAVFNKPGQYYYDESAEPDGSHKVYLWPPDNLDPARGVPITFSMRHAGIDLDLKSHLVVEGFRFIKQTGDSASSPGTLLEGAAIKSDHYTGTQARDVVIRNNEITAVFGVSHAAIRVTHTDDLAIEDNYIHDVRGVKMQAVQAAYAARVAFRRNRIERTSSTCLYMAVVADGSIENNVVLDSRGVHGNGISIYQGSERVTVSGNAVINSNIAFTMQASRDITVFNNVFDGGGEASTDGGPNVVASWGGMKGVIRMMNNTIVGSDASHYALLLKAEEGTEHYLQNNVIDGGRVTGEAPVHASHNLYLGTSWDQAARYGWAFGPGESVADSRLVFRNPSGADYRLSRGSPAVDKGIDLSDRFTSDIDGVRRPQGAAWDIGAYELAE